jgi:hypothetical protein
MKNWGYVCRHFGWRLVVAAILATGVAPVRADDWGNWPVPWPPPGSTNPPGGPTPPGTVVPPPGDVGPPAGSGQPPTSTPPGINVPPAGSGQPPTGAESPPEVPVPPGSPGPSTPEPASAVLGMLGVSAGLLAWRRQRKN